MNYLRNLGKNLAFLAGFGASLLFGNNAEANDNKLIEKPTIEDYVKTEREFSLDFADPRSNFEANSNLMYSLKQLVNLGSDELSENANVFGRIGLFVGDIYFSHIINSSSHELGHMRVYLNNGPTECGIRLGSPVDMTQNFVFSPLYTPTLDQTFDHIIAGLNQNEYNAYLDTNSEISFNDASYFLMNKLRDVAYNILFRDEHPGDINDTLWFLKWKNVDLTADEYLTHSLIADLLSVRTWDSIISIGNYLINGERTTKATVFEINDIKFTPPLINHYMTKKGSFYNITSIINPYTDNPLEVSLGLDIDFLFDGDVDTLRIGGKYNGIPVLNEKYNSTLNPYAYVSFSKSLDFKGFVIGSELYIPVEDFFKIKLKLEYSKNDILENEIKGKDDGIYFLLGMSFKF